MEIVNRNHATASDLFEGSKEIDVNEFNESLNEVSKETRLTLNNRLTLNGQPAAHEYKIQRVQAIAEKLAADLKSPKDYKFFCKCAWKLPESVVWSLLESATRPQVKSPVRYFTAIAAHELQCR